jgi:hypothetical protein
MTVSAATPPSCARSPLGDTRGMGSRRIVRRVALARASRTLLARFLAVHGKPFFEALEVSRAALATRSARERHGTPRSFDLVQDRAFEALDVDLSFRSSALPLQIERCESPTRDTSKRS